MHTTTETIADRVASLRNWARGNYGTEACIEVLAFSCGGYWLVDRADFVAEVVHEADISGRVWFDLEAAARFADTDRRGSDGQRRILQLAVSMASGYKVSLDDTLRSLDAFNTTLVLEAVAHSMGWHQIGYSTAIGGTFTATAPANDLDRVMDLLIAEFNGEEVAF